MDDLGGLCDFRAWLAVGMAGINFASADALFPARHDGHRGNGSAGAADAGCGISRLPENDEHVYSQVSQERTRLNCLSNYSRFFLRAELRLNPQKRRPARRTPHDYKMSRTSS